MYVRHKKTYLNSLSYYQGWSNKYENFVKVETLCEVSFLAPLGLREIEKRLECTLYH